eukprot:5391499-Pleurochrysis_carterae.AAC.2
MRCQTCDQHQLALLDTLHTVLVPAVAQQLVWSRCRDVGRTGLGRSTANIGLQAAAASTNHH